MNARYPSMIDIGSNTVRLVIFEGHPPDHSRRVNIKESCGLWRDLDRTGRLVPAARKRTLKAIESFIAKAKAEEADRPALIATAALREAEDGADFAAEIERRFGLPVSVISGAEEARLAALGVASGMPHADGIVADLGGGSLELVELSGWKTGRSDTLPLGHLRLFHQCDGDLELAAAAIDSILANVAWLKSLRGHALYLAGGSWRKFGRHHIATLASARAVDGYALTRGEVEAFAARLIDDQERRRRKAAPGSKAATSTLAVATLVLVRLMAYAEPPAVVFSTRGMPDGWLMDRLAVSAAE